MEAGRRRTGILARKAFLDRLAESGSPKLAAASIGLTLREAYQLKAADGQFARCWEQAVAMAWEQVEAAVLEQLLAPEPGEKPGRLFDSRLVLAVMQRRQPPVQQHGTLIEARGVERLRAEIRALGTAEPDARKPG